MAANGAINSAASDWRHDDSASRGQSFRLRRAQEGFEDVAGRRYALPTV